MQYIALIYSDESKRGTGTPEENAAMMAGYFAFNEKTKAEGSYLAGEALQPTPTATTVRVRNGETLITDGPFAETQEVLGGFYLLECTDLDHAIARAAEIPGAQYGCVEVRPIMHIPGDT